MNVVLVVFDTLRPDFTALRGGLAHTPNLARLASDAAVFRRAHPESLPTIPVRRALHTGQRSFPFRNYVPRKGDPVQLPGWMPIPEEQVTIAEAFLEAGYRTALVTDNWHLVKPSMNFLRGFTGWDFVRGQVLDFYRSRRLPPEALEPWVVDGIRGTAAYEMLVQHKANTWNRSSETEWTVAQVFLRAADWLTENREAENFFLCIDSFDPHEPWDPPQEYVDLYDPGYVGKSVISPFYGDKDYLAEAELNHIRALYAGEVTLVDRWLGVFLEKMRDLGLFDNTVIAVISDHGICLGEHGLIGKLPWGTYPEVMDIVCMVRPPGGVPGGRQIDDFVYNLDVVPTLFDYAGVPAPHMDSRSLRGLIEDRTDSGRGFLTSMFLDYVWACTPQYWYISRQDGQETKLFNLNEDPNLAVNLANSEPEKVKELHRMVIQDAGGAIPVYDAPPVEALGARWYKQFQMNLRKGCSAG
jgi:arylsulfatase A-like enzyme